MLTRIFAFQPKARGLDLLNKVCEAINLIERDYFGLVYSDRHDAHNWLDLEKRISKFMKSKSHSFPVDIADWHWVYL